MPTKAGINAQFNCAPRRPTMTTWLNDANGNRCSVEYFGSTEAAQKTLDSLKECRNCTNCSDCSHCSGCSHCSDCSRCSGCSGCSGCSRCSHCSDCSRCSGCSRCSNVAFIYNKKDLIGDPSARPVGAPLGQPPIPKIENINARVLEAVSAPKALDMGNWHTCNTTHCRGGWVVHLAGEAGYALERFHDTELAAQLIYRESGSPINPGRFYDSNDDAMADIKRMAELEAKG